MAKVFLSHSHKDKEFVDELSKQIELELSPDVEVFASTRPEAIPSGVEWQPDVFKNLEIAEVLVILVTRPSENSGWVGFEYGYFWKKTGGRRIHALYHPSAQVRSPLDILQAKLVTDLSQLKVFFKGLCDDFDKDFNGKADLTLLAEKAKKIAISPPERSLERFLQLVENARWNEVHVGEIQSWICEEDVAYQIVVDPEPKNFTEEWTQMYADKNGSSRYRVNLNIFGLTVKQVYFVSLDGERYFVPMPQVKVIRGKRKYYWDRDSIEFRLGTIINEFHAEAPSIDDVAGISGIEIV